MQSAILGMSASEERKNRRRANGRVYQLTIHLFAPSLRGKICRIMLNLSKSLLITKKTERVGGIRIESTAFI